MNANDKTALAIVHRILFRALLEIRHQGHEQNNKLVFHLADLFHNIVLDMEAAAEGRSTYEEILGQLKQKAKEKNCQRWLYAALKEIEPLPPNVVDSR